MSGGRVERPADEMSMEEKQKGERPPYKGGYTKGVWRTYKDTEGLALLRPRTNPPTSAD